MSCDWITIEVGAAGNQDPSVIWNYRNQKEQIISTQDKSSLYKNEETWTVPFQALVSDPYFLKRWIGLGFAQVTARCNTVVRMMRRDCLATVLQTSEAFLQSCAGAQVPMIHFCFLIQLVLPKAFWHFNHATLQPSAACNSSQTALLQLGLFFFQKMAKCIPWLPETGEWLLLEENVADFF